MEIAQLPPGDAQLFMQEYDISEPSLNRMIRNSYDLMKLQSFLRLGRMSYGLGQFARAQPHLKLPV
jgi:hypothetical protein